MTLDFLATPWGFACVLTAAALLMGIAVLIAQGKLRFKKTKDGSMVVGDDTPFEKTNVRFKQMCQDTHTLMNVVPILTEKVSVLTEKVVVLTERVATVEKAVDLVSTDQQAMKIRNEVVQVFVLRMTITNERLPAEERMRAYDEYKKRGLNSWVDAYWECEMPEIKKALKGQLAGKVLAQKE
jgi:hypothetical protein